MNVLIVGRDLSGIQEHLPERFLLIDDGALIDALTFPREHRVRRLDFSHHSFDLLLGLDYRRASEIVAAIDALYPRGDGTLTKDSGLAFIFRRLLARPTSLRALVPPPDKRSSTGHVWAYDKIQELLLSPALNKFLCGSGAKFSLSGTVLVGLNPKVLTPLERKAIAYFLISAYQGHVIIPRFGFYGCPFLSSLIDEDRLIAGVHFLDEPKGMRNALLGIETKIAARCNADDAETLATYAGHLRGTDGYSGFMQEAVR